MLFLIDLQNDYFHPDGKFYFQESRDIVEPILQRIQRAKEEGEPILYTLNLYTDEDPRPREIRDWASMLYEPFKDSLQGHLPIKKIYYGMNSEDADRIRRVYKDKSPEEIEVAGATTNVCVLANAVVMQNIFPDASIIISRERTATGDEELGEMTYQVMEGLSMKVTEEAEE